MDGGRNGLSLFLFLLWAQGLQWAEGIGVWNLPVTRGCETAQRGLCLPLEVRVECTGGSGLLSSLDSHLVPSADFLHPRVWGSQQGWERKAEMGEQTLCLLSFPPKR